MYYFSRAFLTIMERQVLGLYKEEKVLMLLASGNITSFCGCFKVTCKEFIIPAKSAK